MSNFTFMEMLRVIFRKLGSPQLLLLGVLITIIGAKFCLIQHYGSDLPFWDQWDAEGDHLFLSEGHGNLRFRDFFVPHNEHRIVFTEALAYALEKIDGQWDARLEMVVDVPIHVLSIALLLLVLYREVGKKQWYPGVLAALLIFSLPLCWENTLSGFQSQFYFLCFFSLAHLAGTFAAKSGSKRWWGAQLCGFCALFSMGSGFFSAVAVLGIQFLSTIRERRFTRVGVFLLSYNLILITLGLWLRTDVPNHASIGAHDLSEFLLSVAKILAWPSPLRMAAALTVIPLIAALWFYLRVLPGTTQKHFISALILWWFLQVLALAYARGGMAFLAFRYFDLLAIGTIVAAVMWPEFLSRLSSIGNRLWAVRALCAAWAVTILWGVIFQVRSAHAFLSPLVAYNENRVERVRDYVTHGSATFFLAKPPSELPYPDAHRLAGLLDEPAIRSILPVSVRPSLPVMAGEGSSGFVRVESEAVKKSPTGYYLWTSSLRPLLKGSATFQSSWIAAPREPFLRFQVTGVGLTEKDGIWLETGKERELVQIPANSIDRWKSIVVDSPKEAFRISARSSLGSALSFTEPVELGLASWLARQILGIGPFLFSLGIVMAVFGFLPAITTIYQRAMRIDSPVDTAE